MKVLRSEASIERAICARLKRDGWLTIKMGGAGARLSAGWPDRLIIGQPSQTYNGRPPFGFLEIKNARGVLSELQAIRIIEIQSRGINVAVVRSVNDAVKEVNEWR